MNTLIRKYLGLTVALASLALPVNVSAQTASLSSLLVDTNGNGQLEVLAFGDSITRGEGDFEGPNATVIESEPPTGEAGYPLRLEQKLSISVANRGEPGDAWFEGGLDRFIRTIYSTPADIVIIGNGSNDARRFISSNEIYRDVQTVVNVARANGSTPVILSIIPACREHDFINGTVNLYNNALYLLAAVNELRVADVAKAFANTCVVSNCNLINRPEGLHPNRDGYDVMGEVVAATLLGIDILAPDGPTLLAQALNVAPATIRTVPNPVAAPVTE